MVTDFGRAWNRATVHQVLTNEKYIGNNVYHRTSFKLKLKHVANPQEKWICADGLFEGIVEFAGQQLEAKPRRKSGFAPTGYLKGLSSQASFIQRRESFWLAVGN